MDELMELARRHGLKLVEDAAQCLGASIEGRPLGTLGDAGVFSFHESKNLTCGEGGALVVRDDAVARRAELIREKGTNRAAFLRGEVDKYTWVAEGSSYVLSELLAAVLDAQLDKQGEIQARRRAVAARYREGLSEWSLARGVRLPPEPPGRVSNHHIFYLLYPDQAGRDRALAALRAQGILASFHYVPLHSSPRGRAFGAPIDSFPVTDRIAGSLLRLPLHPLLESAQLERVIAAVRGA
jgi:dTDP-4-amino-4,6-dideoxygalactose transaminase